MQYLTGELALAEERLTALSARAQTTVDSAAVTCVRINLYTNLGQSDNAVAVGLEYLQRLDDTWSLQPTEEDVQREYAGLWQRLGSEPIEALLDLPLMSDPDRRATMDVLTVLTTPALFTNLNFFRLVVFRMAAVSLEHGNTDGSCLAYVWLGGILGRYFGDHQADFASASSAWIWSTIAGWAAFAPASIWSSRSMSPIGRSLWRPAASCCGAPSRRRGRPAT